MRTRTLMVTACLLAAALAGCVGGDPTPGTTTDEGLNATANGSDQVNATDALSASNETHGNATEAANGSDTNATANQTSTEGSDDDQDEEDNGTEEQAKDQVRYAPGWPSLDKAVVRPGVKVVAGSTFGTDCTANFLFSTPNNRTLLLGTASHCVVNSTIGDPVQVASGALTGTLVYCSWGTATEQATCPDLEPAPGEDEHPAAWNDLALIQLPDNARGKVHPALLHWGGPVGIDTNASQGDRVLTYGNTALRDGDGAADNPHDAREGVVAQRSAQRTTVLLATPSLPGDSGSPVLTGDGLALGVMQSLGAGNGVSNLAPMLAFLHQHTSLQVELKTWPLLAGPTGQDDVPEPP